MSSRPRGVPELGTGAGFAAWSEIVIAVGRQTFRHPEILWTVEQSRLQS